jgi:diguanylate cyclase (GGDEF)-like protein
MGFETPAAHELLIASLRKAEAFVALFDPNDQLIWANDSYERDFLRGLPLPQSFPDVLRHGFHNGFGVRINSGDVEAFLADILPRRRSVRFRAFAVDLVDGRWVWMTETLSSDGCLVSIATDITILKAHEDKLARAHHSALTASLTDDLTQIGNRRHILTVSGELLEQLGPQGLSIAIVDLDHFKAINDRHGHAYGDAVLRHFAAHCKLGLRPDDHIGRIGGEEFLLALPGVDLVAADAVLSRLRATLEPCGDVVYNFSAGLAQAAGGDALDSLISRADLALYEAKRAGRGCNRTRLG